MVRIPIAALSGAHLNVERVGTGSPVVALHGFTGNLATWESFTEVARREFTVVTVDLLGHGASDAPEDPEWYRMERCIRGLEELLDHLGFGRVQWLGYSLGGRIALSAALALPKRTSSLVLESASPGLPTEEERAARVREDERLADWIVGVGIGPFVDYWEALPMWASQHRLPKAVRDRLRAQRLNNRPVGLANSLRGVGTGAQPPLHRRLGELSAPTLLIAGEEDARFAAIAQEMHQSLPYGLLHNIPEAGHATHLEQPERFNQAVLGFLRTTVGSMVPSVTDTQATSLRNP